MVLLLVKVVFLLFIYLIIYFCPRLTNKNYTSPVPLRKSRFIEMCFNRSFPSAVLEMLENNSSPVLLSYCV